VASDVKVAVRHCKWTTLPVVALIAAATLLFVPPAQAFELFGWTIFGDDKKDEDAGETIAYAPDLKLTEDDDDLKSKLENASVLVSRKDDPPADAAALIARARTDRKHVVAELYANGRYGGTVDIRVGGTSVDELPIDASLPQDSQTGAVPISIIVDAGPEFTFGDIDVESVDPNGQRSRATNPAAYGLVPGALASSTAIMAAGDKMVTEWREEGHALARVTDREIIADHDTNTVKVSYRVEPGPVATYAEPVVTGQERMDPDFIRRYAAIEAGKRYDPKELAKSAKSLRDLGVFDAVKIREGTELNPDGTLPMTIEVIERKRRFIGAGVTYSNTDGGAVQLYWGHRNLFGQAERIRIEGSVGRIGDSEVEDLDYSAKIAFAKPGVIGPASEFTADVFAIRENPDAYQRTAAGALVGINYRFDEYLIGKAGFEVERSKITDATGTNNYLLVGVPVSLNYDRRNSKLDATKGFLAMISAEPLQDLRNDKTMGIFEGSLSAYRGLDSADRFVLAGKVAIGSAVGASLRDIPADRRFYLGGGDTIRGYGYQNVGPRNGAGKILGGLSYFLASAEVRTRITETIGLVGFVDTGNAYRDRTPNFSKSLRTGVGAGIRYLTPIGPLRVDAAVPLDKQKDDPDFAIYVGIGQAF